jgi:SAM-dependent methyltransferase
VPVTVPDRPEVPELPERDVVSRRSELRRDGVVALSALPVPGDASPYWAFHDEVARRQVAAWAPAEPSRVLDLSGARTGFAAQLVQAGHDVLHVCRSASTEVPSDGPGRLIAVRADGETLDWLVDDSVDAVLAESRTLSNTLATEVVAAELRRVLRPGGRMLVVVESLVLGLARLAEQGRWAELADVPSADVVLIPWPDGSVTRCFGPEELRELLLTAGFEVEWVRPRTALTPTVVERALGEGGRATFARLVESELDLQPTGERDDAGLYLAASARKPR